VILFTRCFPQCGTHKACFYEQNLTEKNVMSPLATRSSAEFLGTGLLVATIVGSGHMVAALGADPGVGLIMMALAAGAVLVVLIALLGPVSGAHLNPVVSLCMAMIGRLRTRDAFVYVAAQLAGGVAGVVVANLMFASPALALSSVTRGGVGQWLGECVATLGRLVVHLGFLQRRATGQHGECDSGQCPGGNTGQGGFVHG
jgi:glycerol uptake facilitator-like aquaporin